MPTTLDPGTSLVLIDLQRGVTAVLTVHRADEVVDRAARLARAFRSHDLLVVAVRVTFSPDGRDILRTRTAASGPVVPSGPDWAELRPSWRSATPTCRSRSGPGTRSTARSSTCSCAAGGSAESSSPASPRASVSSRPPAPPTRLTVVTDAVTDRVAGAHADSVEVIFPRIAELATTDDVIAALDR